MRKGQAAMEFLLTYGWALLIMTTCIGALLYFDLLNPTSVLPEKCDLGYRISCNDFVLTSTQLKMSVINNFQDKIVLQYFNLSNSNVNCHHIFLPRIEVPAGEVVSFDVNCPQLVNVTEKGKQSYDVATFYHFSAAGDSYAYPLYGKIFSRVVPGTQVTPTTAPPPPPPGSSPSAFTFYIQSGGVNVAKFDDSGNIVLKGTCTASPTCTPPPGSPFILKTSDGQDVAYIDSSGNLCTEGPDCTTDFSCTTGPSSGFVIKSSSNTIVTYISQAANAGTLCYIGNLTQNGAP